MISSTAGFCDATNGSRSIGRRPLLRTSSTEASGVLQRDSICAHRQVNGNTAIPPSRTWTRRIEYRAPIAAVDAPRSSQANSWSNCGSAATAAYTLRPTKANTPSADVGKAMAMRHPPNGRVRVRRGLPSRRSRTAHAATNTHSTTVAVRARYVSITLELGKVRRCLESHRPRFHLTTSEFCCAPLCRPQAQRATLMLPAPTAIPC